MKKIIRLTERDLTRIVKRVIKENEEDKSNEEVEKFRLTPDNLIDSLHHDVKKFIKSQDLDKEESFRRLDYFIQRDIKPILDKAKEKGLWTDEEIDYVKRYLRNAYNYDYNSGEYLPRYSYEDAIAELDNYVNDNIGLGKTQLLIDISIMADSAAKKLSSDDYAQFIKYYVDLENQILQVLPDDEDEDDDEDYEY